MANPAHKIAGPLLRTFDPVTGKRRQPASVQQITDLFVTPVGLRAPRCIVDEWINEAKRKNGLKGSSEIAGVSFRTEQNLRRARKSTVTVYIRERRISRLQRWAKRIRRIFSRR